MSPKKFLVLMRDLEDLGCKIGNPIFIYYSTQSAGRLLPKGPKFRDLMRESKCVSIFSFESNSLKDECSFLMLTPKGGLYIDMEEFDDDLYLCRGSVNINNALDKFDSQKRKFKELETEEAKRVTEAVESLKNVRQDLQLFDEVVRNWNSRNY